MPRAPHIELRTQRLSPANPTNMAMEARLATVTSPTRPSWDPHPVMIKREEKMGSLSKREEGSGAFRPPFRQQRYEQRSPPQHPKTVPVTVIQTNAPVYCRSKDSEAGTRRESRASPSGRSSTEPTHSSSHSPAVSERITTSREAIHSYLPHPYAVDPTYSLHVAVECHRATQQDADGDTPLHIAISQADEIERSLIQHLIGLVAMSGRSVDIFNYVQQTPLHIAVITDNSDVTRLLLEAGANPNETDRNGLTAVHHACVNSSIVCLKTILDKSKFTVDLNARNYNGFAPLHATVMDNNMEMTNSLLATGASVEVPDAKNGWTPLFHAIINQNNAMVARLIEAGAKVNAQSYSGNTALHVATGRGYTDVVRLLMRYGADMSVKNTHRDTPAMMSNDRMISSILRGTGPAVCHNVPHIRVPTRRRDLATPHPLSESVHQQQHRPLAAKSSAQPLSLVTHRRQLSSRQQSRVHTSIGPSPLSLSPKREQTQTSTRNLIIDEERRYTEKRPSTPQRVKTEGKDSQSSCRVSVIVQPKVKTCPEKEKTRTSGEQAKNIVEKLPLVSRMLKERTLSDEDGKSPLPEQENPLTCKGSQSTESDKGSQREDMPVSEPSPLAMETHSPQAVPHSSTATSVSKSEADSSSSTEDKDLGENIISECPLSPAIEMSDVEDEESPASKRRHEAAFSEEDSQSEESSEQNRKRLRKDDDDNVGGPSKEKDVDSTN